MSRVPSVRTTLTSRSSRASARVRASNRVLQTSSVVTTIAGLTGWYTGEIGTEIFGNGNIGVGTWKDQSGNNNDLAQVTYANSFSWLYSPRLQNRRSLFGNTLSTQLTSAVPLSSLISPSAYTVFCVCLPTTANGVAATTASYANPCILSNTASGGAGQFWLGVQAAGIVNLGGNDGASQSVQGKFSMGVPMILTARHGGGVIGITRNREAEVTATQGDTADLTGNLSVGCGYNRAAGSFFNGQIAELIIYNTSLTANQRAQIVGYLESKYGLGQYQIPYRAARVLEWYDARRHNEGNWAATIAGLDSVTSAGTTPPAVTTTGTPTRAVQLYVAIDTRGSRGTATFKYSLDGGTNFEATLVTTAATVAINAGITLNFPVGTYETDNVYTASTTISALPSCENPGAVVASDRTANQATAAKQPTITLSDTINGLPTFNMNASRWLKTGVLKTSVTQPCTIYIVAFVGDQTNVRNLMDGNDSTHRLNIGGSTAGRIALFAGSSLLATVTATSFNIWCAVINNASSALYLANGATAKVTGTAGTQVDTAITLGASYTDSQYQNGRTLMAIVCSGAHSSAQINTISKWLAAQTALTWTAP